MGDEARVVRRRQALALGLVSAGLVLSLVTTNARHELVRRREDACDSTLSLPSAAFVFGFAGLAVGAVAVVLLVRWFRRDRRAVVVTLFATAGVAVVFEVLAVVTAFQQGHPILSGCLP